MVVSAGRTTTPGWDVSGGHVSHDGITFEGGELGRVHDRGVRRHLEGRREDEKGDVTSTYHGKVRDTYWGEEITSTTGSARPRRDAGRTR